MQDLKTTPRESPAGENRTRIAILDLPVDCVTMDEAARCVTTAVEARRAASGAEPHSPTIHVVTINPEMVMAAQTDAQFRGAIEVAELVVPDGIGIVLGARLKGIRLPGRVTGVELLQEVARVAADRGYGLYFLGAAPGVAEEAAARLVARFPGLRVVGTYAGSPRPDEAPEIVARIAASGADILFVAFGAPAQERWIAEHRAQLGLAVAVGIGGAFDFIAGRVPRAPDWMRRSGLEWLYRLWKQPWRWRRMLALPRFAAAVFISSVRERPRGRKQRGQ